MVSAFADLSYRNATYGGTWYENRYPGSPSDHVTDYIYLNANWCIGCACDIPAHTYTYSFEPNPEWSGFYSYSDEIEQYFIKFHDKHNLSSFVRLNTQVVSATWDEEKSQYLVELEKLDKDRNVVEKFTDWCHVLINVCS